MKYYYVGKGILRDERGISFSGQENFNGLFEIPQLYHNELEFKGNSELGQLIECETGLVLHLAKPVRITTAEIIEDDVQTKS